MIVLLEGPDCSGKTTLAKNALDKLEYIHLGPPPDYGHGAGDPAWAQYASLLDQLQTGSYLRANRDFEDDEDLDDVDIVIDRFLYGQRVYGPILRKDTRFDEVDQRMLERVMLSLGVVLVKCMPDYELCRDLWLERLDSELIQREEQFKQVYDKYLGVLDSADVPSIEYFMGHTDVKRLVAALPGMASPKAPADVPGVGMFAEGVTLLVGERINEKASNYDWPFVAESGSSYWLTARLMDAGISERELFWVNSQDRNGRWTDYTFLDELRPNRIIALGRSAELWCKAAKLDHLYVPHPAAWKRFHHGETYPLFDLIKGVR